ncbi:hypothetical protein EYF80_048439 [Liparis tanakae]|uniref:Uncharacterized protein n=1 Tax=Liparis tanakae TaxID=230148 RepID=A0A4Z2FK81_9TELE|nr:hypothetical protein EYF80_048439 [Liparis tanakae]
MDPAKRSQSFQEGPLLRDPPVSDPRRRGRGLKPWGLPAQVPVWSSSFPSGRLHLNGACVSCSPGRQWPLPEYLLDVFLQIVTVAALRLLSICVIIFVSRRCRRARGVIILLLRRNGGRSERGAKFGYRLIPVAGVVRPLPEDRGRGPHPGLDPAVVAASGREGVGVVYGVLKEVVEGERREVELAGDLDELVDGLGVDIVLLRRLLLLIGPLVLRGVGQAVLLVAAALLDHVAQQHVGGDVGQLLLLHLGSLCLGRLPPHLLLLRFGLSLFLFGTQHLLVFLFLLIAWFVVFRRPPLCRFLRPRRVAVLEVVHEIAAPEGREVEAFLRLLPPFQLLLRRGVVVAAVASALSLALLRVSIPLRGRVQTRKLLHHRLKVLQLLGAQLLLLLLLVDALLMAAWPLLPVVLLSILTSGMPFLDLDCLTRAISSSNSCRPSLSLSAPSFVLTSRPPSSSLTSSVSAFVSPSIPSRSSPSPLRSARE